MLLARGLAGPTVTPAQHFYLPMGRARHDISRLNNKSKCIGIPIIH